MAAVASPPPSPPIPDSPGSLSSASSQSASDSSNGDSVPPTKPIPPPLATYTSFEPHKVKLPPSRNASPAGSVASTRTTGRRGPGHRPSQSMSRLAGSASVGGPTTGSHGVSGGGSASPSMRWRGQTTSTSGEGAGEKSAPLKLTRSRTLSFSSTQQAFLPTAPRLTASTSSASFAFPSLEEGVVVASPTSLTLDRTPSTASTASTAPTRRPPRRTQTSLSVRSAHTLRVPGPSAGRPGRVDIPTDYLEAKVVFLGSQGVGKTSLINVATYGRLSQSRSTIGASFHTKKMTVEDTRVHFQLWDSGGQERFKSMAPLYYRGALAAVLVYDMTDAASLDDIKYWLGELRKNMSSELVILVVGTKCDLIGTYKTVPLESAQRNVAMWLWELDHPGESLPFGLSPSATTSMTRPAPPPPPTESRQSSLTRSRTFSTPLAAAAAPTSFAPFPAITTTPAPPPPTGLAASADSFSSRMRNLSNKLTYTSISPSAHPHPPHPSHSASSSSSASGSNLQRPTNGLTSSMTLPDLSGYTLASLNLASPHAHLNAHDTLASAASSAGMARSSSGGAAPSSSSAHIPLSQSHSHTRSSSRHLNLMSLSGLATVTGAGRRLSHDERVRREWEEVERERVERERKDQEREEWVREVVDKCEVPVVEVSATQAVGIDSIFLSIASQLIARKAEIEAQRVLRSRDSIVLRDEDHVDTTKAGWCAC
ncbi:hypothetical protein JCM6882_000793 [Rhodosporidiobolus microsporus]